MNANLNFKFNFKFNQFQKVKPYAYDDIRIFPLDIYKDVIKRSVACVNASGRGLRFGCNCIDNEIVVDTRSAAPGRLSYNMTGKLLLLFFKLIAAYFSLKLFIILHF